MQIPIVILVLRDNRGDDVEVIERVVYICHAGESFAVGNEMRHLVGTFRLRHKTVPQGVLNGKKMAV